MAPKKQRKEGKSRKAKGQRVQKIRGVTQGVGRVTRKAFGSKSSKRTNPIRGFDAAHPYHLSLPIATGPYTVARFTQIVESADPVMMFGTFKSHYSYETAGNATNDRAGWGPYIAAGNGVDDVPPITNCKFWKCQALANMGQGMTMVPSALSVQVMNPNALQTTNGIIYIGRLNTQFRGQDVAKTWKNLANEFVSFQSPRLCSAGKLALRGVKVDAAPYNMTELQDFDEVVDIIDSDNEVTSMGWNTAYGATGPGGVDRVLRSLEMKGFAPIGVYNPEKVNLQYLVTLEVRTRFEVGNPAASTHRHHAPSTQQTWGHAIQSLIQQGHGVLDIVEAGASLALRARDAGLLMG